MEGLNLEYTAWSGVKLACGRALGIVIYIGKDLKMTLNAKEPTTKFGKLDW
jgi:phospholipid-translocating ATPase